MAMTLPWQVKLHCMVGLKEQLIGIHVKYYELCDSECKIMDLINKAKLD